MVLYDCLFKFHNTLEFYLFILNNFSWFKLVLCLILLPPTLTWRLRSFELFLGKNLKLIVTLVFFLILSGHSLSRISLAYIFCFSLTIYSYCCLSNHLLITHAFVKAMRFCTPLNASVYWCMLDLFHMHPWVERFHVFFILSFSNIVHKSPWRLLLSCTWM